MKFNFTEFLYALSYSLDAVEREVTGASAGHGKRVALISCLCAESLELSDEERIGLAACAILHDNAIAEYLREELDYTVENAEAENSGIRSKYGTASVHAYIGERKIKKLPLSADIANVILWHHENADGSGPFGLKEHETNLFSQLIHLSDVIDLGFGLATMTPAGFEAARKHVRENAGKLYSTQAAELFLSNVSWEHVEQLQQLGPQVGLTRLVPDLEREFTIDELTGIASFFTDIVDFKSSFTKNHSLGVAQKAEAMGRFYEFDPEKLVRFAFAGAFHDIGKLTVDNDILEKPGKLDAQEFGEMKNHAAETLMVLKSVSGFEDIAEWAANHHEKLDGTGYSRRLTADQQSFEDRIMACVDIYQALTEPRPYKDGLSHRRSISIMQGMANDGKIDARIVADLDTVFGKDAPESEEDSSDAKLTTKRWKCAICGYIYEGDTAPASCPICSSSFDSFVLVD